MRPGQEAPDDRPCDDRFAAAGGASMRPGQEAPDDVPERADRDQGHAASMRPGQEAPDDIRCSRVCLRSGELQ